MNAEADDSRPFHTTEVVAGTVLAALLVIVFTAASNGRSLTGTFVPGVVFAYVVFLIVARRGLPPSPWQRIAPLYFLTLAVQFLHFAEEYAMGFADIFPVAYGGVPFSPTVFVAFNMAAYAVFVGAALAALRKGVRPLLIPVLFFAMYGTWGNAISHTTWCVLSGGYFPGVVTALGYFVIGPLLLYAFIEDWKIVWLLLALFAVTLVICALVLFTPPAELANQSSWGIECLSC